MGASRTAADIQEDDHELERVRRRPRRSEAAQSSAAGEAAALGLALGVPLIRSLASLAPSERARAQGGPVEADLAALAPGALSTVESRGKQVWILRRTNDMIARLSSAGDALADPESKVSSLQPSYAADATRSIRPDVFVAIGLCTHLGCIPTYQPEPGSLLPSWPGGFCCPCHGSRFDLAERVYRDRLRRPTSLCRATASSLRSGSSSVGAVRPAISAKKPRLRGGTRQIPAYH